MSPVRALLARELTLAIRSGGGTVQALVFFLIFITMMPFGIGPNTELLAQIAPGALWLGALFACLLSLDRIFQTDAEDGTLEALALSPLPLEFTVAIKSFAHWLTTGLPLTILSPILAISLSLPPQRNRVVDGKPSGWNPCAQPAWNHRRGANFGTETRRLAGRNPDVATLHPNADFWRARSFRYCTGQFAGCSICTVGCAVTSDHRIGPFCQRSNLAHPVTVTLPSPSSLNRDLCEPDGSRYFILRILREQCSNCYFLTEPDC